MVVAVVVTGVTGTIVGEAGIPTPVITGQIAHSLVGTPTVVPLVVTLGPDGENYL